MKEKGFALPPILLVGFLIVILAGALLSFFVIQRQTSSLLLLNERTLLKSIIVPYSYNGDIYLVRGDGSRSEKFRTVMFVEKFTDYDGYDGYLSVHIDPKQTHLVAVKSLGQKKGGGFDGASRHRLVSIDLTTGAEEILIEAQPLERIMCPQWSPNGKQIAFWRDDDYRSYQRSDASGVFLWNLETNSLHQISKPITTFFDSCEDMGTYLRWVDEGRLAINNREEGIWLVDVRKGTSEFIPHTASPGFEEYRKRFSYLAENVIKAGWGDIAPGDFHTRTSHLPSEVVPVLWGNPKNPRRGPYWSPDKRFYFYHVVREGFGAERWIERFDPKIGKSFKIKTIWWTLYRE